MSNRNVNVGLLQRNVVELEGEVTVGRTVERIIHIQKEHTQKCSRWIIHIKTGNETLANGAEYGVYGSANSNSTGEVANDDTYRLATGTITKGADVAVSVTDPYSVISVYVNSSNLNNTTIKAWARGVSGQ